MNIDDYCKAVNMSRDYAALYHLLIKIGEPKDGRGIPCYVDYSIDRNNPDARKLRDIAAVKFWPEESRFQIGARGIEYGDFGYYGRSGKIITIEEFNTACTRMNLEWVAPKSVACDARVE